MGPATLRLDQIVAWFESHAPAGYAALVPLPDLAGLFLEEGHREGVRGDVAFMQAIVETGWFRWPSGSVRPEFNNFGGLGATDVNPNANRFPDARTGVRAHIQHLRRYADPTATTPSALHAPLVDARFDLVTPAGKAPLWNQFGFGIWASSRRVNPSYAESILSLFADALEA